MINQLGSIHSRAYSDFKQPQNGWYLPMHPQEEEKVKNKKWGMTLVLSALFVGFGTLALSKGTFAKKVANVLEKWKIKLEQKAVKDGKVNNFYRYSIGKINSFLEKSESINNFTTLKDVLFQKFMFGKDGKRTLTKNLHQSITKMFDKLSRNTVNSSYGNTQRKFATLNEEILAINEKLLRQNQNNQEVLDIVKSIGSRLQNVNTNLDKGFGINARNARLKQMNDASDGLFDYFWNASFSDIKNFKSKNMWQSFIAEDYMLPHKIKMSRDVAGLRSLITHDINDSYIATNKAIEHIQRFVNPSDTSTNHLLSELRNCLNKYKRLSGSNEASERALLNGEISEILKKLSGNFESVAGAQGYSSEAITTVSDYIKQIDDIITNNSKGELQEILTLYKKILPRNEYLKLKSQINAAVKSLDSSIETETIKYFDKSRDLKLGAAPTDVLSILGTVGSVGWFLGKSKNKDERTSVALKYGIPAIGAIATSLFCTAKLISGGKSFGFGLLSGWVMNIIGENIDNVRKKYSLDISLQNKSIVKPQSDKV